MHAYAATRCCLLRHRRAVAAMLNSAARLRLLMPLRARHISPLLRYIDTVYADYFAIAADAASFLHADCYAAALRFLHLFLPLSLLDDIAAYADASPRHLRGRVADATPLLMPLMITLPLSRRHFRRLPFSPPLPLPPAMLLYAPWQRASAYMLC